MRSSNRTADMAYLTISTGIGAGVVLGGKLVAGDHSLAEVGHTVIDWRAWRGEGKASTLEELASGTKAWPAWPARPVLVIWTQ